MEKNGLLRLIVSIGLFLVLAVPLVACAQTTPASAPAPAPAGVPAPAPKPAPVVLKTLTFRSEEASLKGYNIYLLRDRIKELSNGQLVVDIIGGPEVFPENEQFTALTNGLVDLGVFTSPHFAAYPQGYLVNLAPIQDDGTLKPAVREFLINFYQPLGVRFVGRMKMYDAASVFLRKKVSTLADFKGLKLIQNSKAHLDFISMTGATGVKIAGTEYHDALDRGTGDGIALGIDVVVTTLIDVIKFIVSPPYKTDNNCSLYMNLATWNKLPKNLQDVLANAQLSVEKDGFITDKKIIDDDWKLMNAAKVQNCELPKAEADKYVTFYNEGIWKSIKTLVKPEADYLKMRELSGLK